jgi:hypothetical protein
MIKRDYPYVKFCFLTSAHYCGRNPDIKADQAFLAIPFKREFDDVSKKVKEVFKKKKINVRRIDDRFANTALLCEICNLIQESKFFIADISELNPNVFFELGLAHGLSRIVIIINDKNAKIPADISAPIRIIYDRKCLTDFSKELLQKIRDVKILEYQLDPYISNYKYRVTRYLLDIDVEENGDAYSYYDITVQSINSERSKKDILFKMPYHDTPLNPTNIEEFNLSASIYNTKDKLPIEWILKSRIFKRFCIKLPEITYEKHLRFNVSLFEKGLFNKEDKIEYYDLVIHYPMEKLELKINFPLSWRVGKINELNLVDGDSGLPAKNIDQLKSNIPTQKESKSYDSIYYQATRPTIGHTYLLKWVWD